MQFLELYNLLDLTNFGDGFAFLDVPGSTSYFDALLVSITLFCIVFKLREPVLIKVVISCYYYYYYFFAVDRVVVILRMMIVIMVTRLRMRCLLTLAT